MTAPRRRIVRPEPTPPSAVQQRLHDAREILQREQGVLARRMSRMKRAFHAVEKQQQRIARLERRVRNLEND